MYHCEMIACKITQMRHISLIFPILNGSHKQFGERFYDMQYCACVPPYLALPYHLPALTQLVLLIIPCW